LTAPASRRCPWDRQRRPNSPRQCTGSCFCRSQKKKKNPGYPQAPPNGWSVALTWGPMPRCRLTDMPFNRVAPSRPASWDCLRRPGYRPRHRQLPPHQPSPHRGCLSQMLGRAPDGQATPSTTINIWVGCQHGVAARSRRAASRARDRRSPSTSPGRWARVPSRAARVLPGRADHSRSPG